MSELPLATSSWDNKELDALMSVVNSGFYTMGKQTKAFEENFAQWVGRRYAVMVNSGSSANLLAVASIKYGNLGKKVEFPEVIVPAVSWLTTYSPLEQLGYKIKLVDVESSTFNMQLDLVEDAITSNTVGIFGVNLLGNSIDWKRLSFIAENNDLWLLEDNCESMGSKFDSSLTGTHGLASTFSFFFSHHICTMEGGMVVTDDDNFAKILRSMRAHGWSREIPKGENFLGFERGNDWEENFRFYLPGFNLRPLEISAAIGTVQLEKIDKIVFQRRKNAIFLANELKNRNLDWKMQEELGESSWFTFGFVHKEMNDNGTNRSLLVKKLDLFGIQSRPIVAGNIFRHPVASKMNMMKHGNLENADHLHFNGFMIGNHHFDVSKQLLKFLDLLEEK